MTETSADPVASDKPVRRKMLRWLLVAVAALVVLVTLAAAGMWTWAGRAGSLPATLEWVSRHALPAGARLTVHNASGSLRHGGQIQQLLYTSQSEQGRLVLRLDDVRLQWDLSVLARSLNVQQLHVHSLSVADARQSSQADKSPMQPLQQLTLPLDIQLPVQIDHIYIHSASATQALMAGDASDVAAVPAGAASAVAAVLQQVQAVASAAGTAPQVLNRTLFPQNGQGSIQVSADSKVGGADRADSAPLHIQDVRLLYQWQRQSTAHHLDLQSLAVAHSRWQAQADVQGVVPMRSQLQLQGVLDTAALRPAGGQPAVTQLGLQVQAEGTLAGADAQLQVQAHLQPYQADRMASHAAAAAIQQPDAVDKEQQTQAAARRARAANSNTINSNTMQLHAQATIQPWQPMLIQRAQAHWQHVNAAVLWPQAPQTDLQGSLTLEPDGAPAVVAASAQAAAPGALGFLG